MAEKADVGELDLNDAELMEVLENHGMGRRSLMKVFGIGAGVAALGGTAAGKPGRGNRIDKIYGAPYAADEDTVPSGLVDHAVELHVHGGDATHEGFPAPDGDDEDDQDDAPETFFDPVGLHVKPGEIVNFNVHHGLHTVTSFHDKFSEPPVFTLPTRVPTDHGFTSPPVAPDDSWLYKFTTKGVYDFLCLPHIPLGMVGRIVVFDPEEDSLDDSKFDDWGEFSGPPGPGDFFFNAHRVLTESELDPANIVSAGEVAWSDLTLP